MWGDGHEWEEDKTTIDSGVVDTVGPTEIGAGFPIQETEASTNGRSYRAANNTKIAVDGSKA